MRIENEYILNSSGVRCIEILNDAEKETSFEYYIMCPGFVLEFAFGVSGAVNSPRMSENDCIKLWDDGYFDYMETVTEFLESRC